METERAEDISREPLPTDQQQKQHVEGDNSALLREDEDEDETNLVDIPEIDSKSEGDNSQIEIVFKSDSETASEKEKPDSSGSDDREFFSSREGSEKDKSIIPSGLDESEHFGALQEPDTTDIREQLQGLSYSDIFESKSGQSESEQSKSREIESDSEENSKRTSTMEPINVTEEETKEEIRNLLKDYQNGENDDASTVSSYSKKKKKKKKNKGVTLNYDAAMELEYQVQVNLIKHNLATLYFTSRDFWIFTVPQGLLTMTTSILAFVSTAGFLTKPEKIFISTFVGCISAIVVFLQTMGGVCDYGTRGSMHASAAIDMRDLRDEIILIKFKLKKEEDDIKEEEAEAEANTLASLSLSKKNGLEGIKEEEVPASISTRSSKKIPGVLSRVHDDSDSDSDSDDEDLAEQDSTFGRIQQRYRQSLSGCKSIVPMQLSEAFHGMNSNLMVMDSMDQKRYMANIYGPKTNYSNLVHFKAFDILAEELMQYWLFPIFLPDPRTVAERAMQELEIRMDKSHSHWDRKERQLKKHMVEQEEEDQKLDQRLANSSQRVSTLFSQDIDV